MKGFRDWGGGRLRGGEFRWGKNGKKARRMEKGVTINEDPGGKCRKKR